MRWWTAYRDGLVEPTIGSLVVVVAIALTGVAGLWLGTTDQRIAEHPGDYALNPLDSAAWATAEALALSDAADDEARLVLIGDGGLREALVSIEDLAERTAQAGIDAQLTVVSAWGQSVDETAQVADFAPPGSGLLVLAVGPVDLGGRASGAGLGIGSQRSRFVATRAYRSLLAVVAGPIEPRPHLADVWQGKQDAGWPTLEQAAPALERLTAAARRAEERGYAVVLLQTPTDSQPDWLAAAADSSRLDLISVPAPSEALAGGRYLLDEAERHRWTEALVEELALAWPRR